MSNRSLKECGPSALAGLERVAFFPGQMLTAVDLTAEQDHVREKLRRHNRFLHGWGVVCGLAIVADPTDEQPWRVRIQPGYALDQAGDEIFVGEAVFMDLAKCGAGAATDPCEPRLLRPGTSGTAGTVILAIKYAECKARPVRSMPAGCGCGEETCEYSRIRDSFSIECLGELPASHAKTPNPSLCEILAKGLVVPCPTIPSDLLVVIGRITLPPAPGTKITDERIDNMSDRRILFSTALLQEQLIACCCGAEPGLAADLAIDKKLSVDGRTVVCTIKVTNNGPNRAENVVVTDTLSGVQIGQVGGFEPDQNWTQRDSTQPLVAELGSMESGQVIELRFEIVVRQLGVLTNKARVKSDTVDPNPKNNEVTRSIDLVSGEPLQADLAIKLGIERLDNQRARIIVNAYNEGPAAASNATVKLVIKSQDAGQFSVITEGPDAPRGSWASMIPTQPQQACQLDALLGLLPPGQKEVLSITIQRTTRQGGLFGAEAQVVPPSGTTDPKPGNNTDQGTIDLRG